MITTTMINEKLGYCNSIRKASMRCLATLVTLTFFFLASLLCTLRFTNLIFALKRQKVRGNKETAKNRLRTLQTFVR